MNASELRRLFDALAKRGGFFRTKSAWFRVSPETIVAIDLQRSRHGRQYYLNLRVWVQGLWDRTYSTTEVLRQTGDIFRREPPEFSQALDLERDIEPSVRQAQIERLFRTFVNPISEAFATRDGIRQFVSEHGELIQLLPAVREQLGI